MRVLSVSTTLPYPPDHGTRLRTWHLLRRLAGRAEVTALSWDDGTDPSRAEAVRQVVRELLVAPVAAAPMGQGARVRRWARALAGGHAPFVQALIEERPTLPHLSLAVEERHRREPFDVVVAEDDAAAFLLPRLDAPVVCNRHNVFSRTIADLRRGTAVGRMRALVEAGVWRRLDSAARGDAVIATTEESARALRESLGGAPVDVVPNGVEVPRRTVDPRGGTDIVFIGTMGYAPNAGAVEWFVRHVWERVRHRVPAARFRIIGRGGPERLRHLEVPGVELLGFVPDLSSVCSSARLGVVPLQAGMGIKNKTLDMLAMGLPVVATAAGAEGIPPGSATGVLVADDPASFAREVAGVLTDPGRAAELGARGRSFVSHERSWEMAAARYWSFLEEVAATARAAEVGG